MPILARFFDNAPLTLSLFPLIPLMLLLWGVKAAPRGELFDDALDLRFAKAVQGIAAVLIMIHHLTQRVTNYGEHYFGPVTGFNEFGVLFTGIFFFFSGYGLYTSLQTKEHYLDGFFRRRMPKIVIPFYVANCVYILICMVFGLRLSALEAVEYFSGYVLFNSNLWYMVEIAVLYCAFYVIFRLIRNRRAAIAVMALFVALLMTGSLLLGHDLETATQGAWFRGEWWYNTTPLFIVGMLLAAEKESIFRFASKHYALLLASSAALFFAFYRLYLRVSMNYGYWTETARSPAYGDKAVTLAAQAPMVIFFVLTLAVLMMKLHFDNRVLRWLGSIALELYMTHNVFIELLGGLFKRPIVYWLAVFACSLVLAALVHALDALLLKKAGAAERSTK